MPEIINPNAYAYKLVVLGHYSVGKSSLVLNFVKGEFNENEESTIGASFMTKTVVSGNNVVKFEIWDTAGQERYYSLIPMYYRGAHTALVVYDATLPCTFETAKRWVEELKYDKPQEFVKVLVVNKIDKKDCDQELIEKGREYARQEKMMFVETSAKTGEGIDELFSYLAESLPRNTIIKNDRKKLKKKKSGLFCC